MKSIIFSLLFFFVAVPSLNAANGSSTVLFVSDDDRMTIAMVDDDQFNTIFRAYLKNKYVFVRSPVYKQYYLAVKPIRLIKRGGLYFFLGVTGSGRLIYVSQVTHRQAFEKRFCQMGCRMYKSVDEYFVYGK